MDDLNNKSKKNRILFIVSEDWYFISHRLYLAQSAIKEGYEVALLSNFSKHKNRINEEGIISIEWGLKRISKNPINELKAIITTIKALRDFKPDLIHAVAFKPIIYSSLASMLTGMKNCVFALAGLGGVYTSKKMRSQLMVLILKPALRFFLKGKNSKLILQNPEDKNAILSNKLIREDNIFLIRSAGVDTKHFSFEKIPYKPPKIILSARMLWSKGIKDFIKCAKIINKDTKIAEFVLVGSPDKENSDAIPIKFLEDLNTKKIITYLGYRDDMNSIYKNATIICLPTLYGEGVPKSLVEAASCGRPIVTYDMPGCREIVINKKNGFLVKPGSINGMVSAIKCLIYDKKLCTKMGQEGRKIVMKNFTQEKVAFETIEIWKKLLKK